MRAAQGLERLEEGSMEEQKSTDAQPRLVTSSRYFNRELSWLSFNQRVLAEASNPDYPLLERLRFLSISGSNLDEFMMVRVAGLAGQIRRQIEEVSIDGMTPSQQLAAIRDAVQELEAQQQDIWRDLQALLEKEGIALAGRRLSPAQAHWVKDYFLEHILPVITPQAIDPAHPFPFISNQGMGILFSLNRNADRSAVMEMVLIPPALTRFVRLPGKRAVYISVEELICRNAALLFPGFDLLGHGVFRVLRDSDIEVEEDAEDLVRYFRTAIQRRRRGMVIQLQLQGDFDPTAEQLLRDQLGAGSGGGSRTSGLVGYSGLPPSSRKTGPTSSSNPTARAIPSASSNMTATASPRSARRTSSSTTPTKASRW
jgi:polyphosphate kinase